MEISLCLKSIKVLGSSQFKNTVEGGYLHAGKAMLQPAAADGCLEFIDYFDKTYDVKPCFSDMFRVAADQASLCRARGKGCETVGYSGHNVGLSFDLHTNRIFAQFRCMRVPYSLRTLRADLRLFGWTPVESRVWHFDFLSGGKSMRKILDNSFESQWGKRLSLDIAANILKDCGYILAEENVTSAISKFQRDFALGITGKLNVFTCRALATVSTTIELI